MEGGGGARWSKSILIGYFHEQSRLAFFIVAFDFNQRFGIQPELDQCSGFGTVRLNVEIKPQRLRYRFANPSCSLDILPPFPSPDDSGGLVEVPSRDPSQRVRPFPADHSADAIAASAIDCPVIQIDAFELEPIR